MGNHHHFDSRIDGSFERGQIDFPESHLIRGDDWQCAVRIDARITMSGKVLGASDKAVILRTPDKGIPVL